MNKYKVTFIEFSGKSDYKITIDFNSDYDTDKLGDSDGLFRDKIYEELNKKYKSVMIYNIEKQ